MAGIIFFATEKYDRIVEFYNKKIGLELWMDQGGCSIFKSGNLLLGFCDRDKSETDGCITIFYETKAEVDSAYECLKDIADKPPEDNPQYKIYHFWAKDPDGRTLEFQSFNHEIPPI